MKTSYLPSIEKALATFFTQMTQEGIRWNSQMSSYHLSTGGKRLRAIIPCHIFESYGKSAQDAVPLGCALELTHNATLVHDDLQDQDSVRRGMPTVWKKYSNAQAINCGDALFQFAFEILMDLDVSPKALKNIFKRLTRGTLLVIEGQAQEFIMKDEAYPGLNRYLEVVSGKTAALFAASVTTSLEALREPCGLTENEIQIAEQAALKSGVLFQIQDDLLDLYGDKKRDQSASDIAEGKISALIAALNDVADEADRKKTSEILLKSRETTTPEDVETVLGYFAHYKIPQKLVQDIRQIQHFIETDSSLDPLPAIRSLLTELNRKSIEPIQHLF